MTRERSRGRKRGTEKCNVSARKSKSQDVPINYEGVRGSGVKQGREGGAVGRRGSREEGGVELVATNKSHSLTPNRTVRFNRADRSNPEQQTGFNEGEFEAMNRAFNSLHAGIKEIYDEMRQADQEEDESCHDYEVHGDDLK
ncbi:uncharacterized protein LOC142345321 isoform X3 [Convolutriloba macropyga]|uniref:uncharacterized protein LOC142345321 isoform X3 n=1 Tax=Convolutriloba macropyga TaxID=536237 RepID=UPI003F51BDD1